LQAYWDRIGYKPLLIKDIPDFEHYGLQQKLVAIAGMSRFIVIDDSNPSGHLIELEICRLNRWVTIVLRVHGCPSSWMTAGISLSSTVAASFQHPRPAGSNTAPPTLMCKGKNAATQKSSPESRREWDELHRRTRNHLPTMQLRLIQRIASGTQIGQAFLPALEQIEA
jgi:hypothetical protein